jgi:hypothetical protein
MYSHIKNTCLFPLIFFKIFFNFFIISDLFKKKKDLPDKIIVDREIFENIACFKCSNCKMFMTVKKWLLKGKGPSPTLICSCPNECKG